MFEACILTDSVLRFPAPGIPPKSFFPGGEGNEPEQKRAALPCKFFAKGWCFNGVSCKFLHVKENSNCFSQQLAENSMAGNGGIRSDLGMLYHEIVILFKIVIPIWR